MILNKKRQNHLKTNVFMFLDTPGDGIGQLRTPNPAARPPESGCRTSQKIKKSHRRTKKNNGGCENLPIDVTFDALSIGDNHLPPKIRQPLQKPMFLNKKHQTPLKTNVFHAFGHPGRRDRPAADTQSGCLTSRIGLPDLPKNNKITPSDEKKLRGM